MVENLNLKLSGELPVTREELIILINSWGRNESHSSSSKSIYKNLNLSNLDVSQIKDMSHIFNSSLYNGDLSKWNVINVINMKSMFLGSFFNNDSLKNWKTKNLLNASHMFAYSHFNGDLSNWNTISLIDISWMFASSKFNNNSLKNWNVRNVKNMSYTFAYTEFNQDISNWNVINLVYMNGMFYNSKFNGNLSKWKFKNLINTQSVFCNNNCFKDKKIKYYLENYHIIKSKDFKIDLKSLEDKILGKNPVNKFELLMFINSWGRYKDDNEVIHNCFYIDNKKLFKIPLENLDVSLIDDFSYIFYGSNYNGDLSKWNISNVKKMNRMFMYSKFNNDSLKNWIVSSVEEMESIFCGSKFNGDISNWDIKGLHSLDSFFRESKFNGDLSKWDLSKIKSISYIFYKSSFNNQSISNWNVTNVEDFMGAFKNINFHPNISNWNLHNKQSFYAFFENNELFKKIYNNGNELPNETSEFLKWFNEYKDIIYLNSIIINQI